MRSRRIWRCDFLGAPSAREAPFFGARAEFRFDRVHFHICHCVGETNIVADCAVKVLSGPQRTLSVQAFVDLDCRERLPTVQDVSQRSAVAWGHNDVDVVGHYAPRVQIVACPVEVKERPFDNSSCDWIGQQGFAVAAIKSQLDALSPFEGFSVAR